MKIGGKYKIEVIDKATRTKEIIRLDNMLMYINQRIHISLLAGTFQSEGFSINDLDIKYFAFGDSSAPASAFQTSLGNELFRKQITSKQIGASFVRSIVSLTSNEANFNIREIGVFAGANATMEAGSGIMISRAVVNIQKFENKIVNITRDDYVNIN